jgi:D-methionine transport system ATP-binding protein
VHTPKPDIKKRVSELLALVHLEDKRHAYPANLSGGQKQRVAIARALASHPKVLLCDEATSALDPASTNAILALLKDINQRLRITILLITHEMEVVKAICDEIAILSNGMLVEQGSVGEIFSNPKTEVAKQFIESSLHIDVPVAYQQRLRRTPDPGKNPLVQLHVNGAMVDTPALSEASRLFEVDNHIVSARIDSAGDVTFGVLIIEVRGQPGNAQKTIEYFKQKQFNTTVLGYV